jgi:hypothetical protein
MSKLKSNSDPEHFQRLIAGKQPGMVRVAGLDLGNNCGIAWADFRPGQALDTVKMFAGQWILKLLGDYDTGPLRMLRLKSFLNVLAPDLVGFGDVRFTPDALSLAGKPVGVIVARVSKPAELLGAFKVTLTTWAEENGIPAQGYGIGEIKKYATGKGMASKEVMIAAANVAFGANLDPDDYKSTGADNIADAMHVCSMVLEQYAAGFKPPA